MLLARRSKQMSSLYQLGILVLTVCAHVCTGYPSESQLHGARWVASAKMERIAFTPCLTRPWCDHAPACSPRCWDGRTKGSVYTVGVGQPRRVGGTASSMIAGSRRNLPLTMFDRSLRALTFSRMAGKSLKSPGRKLWDSVVGIVNPQYLLLYIAFQILYARALRLLYQVQVQVWRLVRKHDPPPYSESVLGFLEPRLHLLSRVLAVVYLINGAVGIMIASGWKIEPQLAKVISDVIYCWYAGSFIDHAKRFFLPMWVPSLKADKRKGFIYNRSLSVFTWAICSLYVVEIISVFLRIPITSTLAFGGIGGLAFGLAGKDVLSNFFGGLMLLLAEPFIPGDMVTFQRNGVRCEGRVERVGWYQTRLRGRDTRPTYVPNSVFVDSMVTNMDRITHRKFETNFELRYCDLPKVTTIVQGIKAALKEVPNIDLLSPFRVHLVDFSPSGLKFTIVCYFATKSFDEFLYLQQIALLEVARVTEEAGATMTSVYHVDMTNPSLRADLLPSNQGTGRVEGLQQINSFEDGQGGGGLNGIEEGRQVSAQRAGRNRTDNTTAGTRGGAV